MESHRRATPPHPPAAIGDQRLAIRRSRQAGWAQSLQLSTTDAPAPGDALQASAFLLAPVCQHHGMETCWIFAHPDDEAFGPGLAMARLARAGHGVHLLTLTRGGASRLREELGVTRMELELLRAEELRSAAQVLGCSSAQVLAYPDGRLAQTDRVSLTASVHEFLCAKRPRLVVTLPPHGINGHPDHCTTSAVAAQAWWQYARDAGHPTRLMCNQLPADIARDWSHGTHGIDPAQADLRVAISEELRTLGREALACHVSQQAVIAEHRPLDRIGDRLVFTTLAEWG